TPEISKMRTSLPVSQLYCVQVCATDSQSALTSLRRGPRGWQPSAGSSCGSRVDRWRIEAERHAREVDGEETELTPECPPPSAPLRHCSPRRLQLFAGAIRST